MKDKMKVSVYGVGVLGEDYQSNERNTITFNLWNNMLKRCYSTRESAMASAYKGCEVKGDFLNFSLFKKWCLVQIGYGKDGWQLDKDLLLKDNKVYSTETCCFLPKEVNNVLVKRTQHRGDYLIGVGYKPLRKQYRARCNMYGVNKHLGWFGTELEAFHAYKQAKEDYIKEVANKWKDQIDPRVYEALMNYQVEITD